MVALTSMSIERSLWLGNIVLCSVLIGRLYLVKLAATYRFFFTSITFTLVRSISVWQIDPRSPVYATFWKATEPISWLLSTLVVLELCSLIFKEYRGIQVLGRRTIYASLAASVLISLILLMPTWRHSNQAMLSIPRFLMVERGVDSALVILLLLLLAFLALLPIPLNRNVVIHSVLYSTFFMASSLGIFIANMTNPQTSILISTCLMGVAFLCLVAWIGLLSPEGETKVAVMPKPLPAAYEQRLVEQLSSINATLLRASSKVESARLVGK
jgi:hypothetical protein